MAARSKGRRRVALMESDTEDALRRRGTELLGMILLGLAGLAFVTVWSYSPDDPSLFSATDAAPRNALGLIGASLADPLHRALGWASYGIATALGVWGLRLVFHAGENRAVSRAILTPVALLAAAAFAATHVPLAGWVHDYGLGGLLGDAVLGTILSTLPFGVGFSLMLASLVLGAIFVATSFYALGVTWGELRGFFSFLGSGSVLVYAGLHGATGRALSSAQRGVTEVRARRAEAAAAAPGGVSGSLAGALSGRLSGALSGALSGGIPRFDAAPKAPGLRPAPPLTAPLAPAALRDDDVSEIEEPFVPEPRVHKPAARALPQSQRARAEAQPELALDGEAADAYVTPPLSLLQNPSTIVRHHLSNDALEENARMLETVLDDYGVRGEIVAIRPGPVVTMYELEPAAGLKASRVIGLADDIARSMSALACRVSTIPGRSVIGIELPNELREKVLLREILSAKGFGDSAHALPLALGKDIGGEPVVANLARMPHLLIAGTTGSGKSVAINTMILSLLYKLSPADCRLIMIDPEDAGAQRLRRHPAPALAGRHRPQEGGGGAEVGGGGDGRALPQDVEDGRAQHRRLQCAGE